MGKGSEVGATTPTSLWSEGLVGFELVSLALSLQRQRVAFTHALSLHGKLHILLSFFNESH